MKKNIGGEKPLALVYEQCNVSIICHLLIEIGLAYLPKTVRDQSPRPHTFRRHCVVDGHSITRWTRRGKKSTLVHVNKE